jgi:hypothetical protein
MPYSGYGNKVDGEHGSSAAAVLYNDYPTYFALFDIGVVESEIASASRSLGYR